LIIAISLILSACIAPGTPPGEIVLAQDDPNNMPGQLVTTIDNSKTDYEICLETIGELDIDTTEFCKELPVDTDLALMPAFILAEVTPGSVDNVAVFGLRKTAKGVVYALVLSGAYALGTVASKNADELVLPASHFTSINMEAELGPLEIHDPAHDVLSAENLPMVRDMTANFGAWAANGGPRNRNTNQDYLCRGILIGGQIVRYMLFESSTRYLLIWADGQWITFYPRDGELRVAKNILDKYPNAKLQPLDCKDFPPGGFPPLPAS